MQRNPDRLLQAAIDLIDRAGGKLNRYKLNKALFYLDLYHYAETGETYTGATYIAEKFGPVVQDYKEALITPLLTSGAATEPPEREGTQAWKSLELAPGSQSDVPDEIGRLGAKVLAMFQDPEFDLDQYVHENMGWKCAYHAGAGTPVNILLAYEQIAPHDAWIDEPLTDHELAQIELSRAGGMTEWQ